MIEESTRKVISAMIANRAGLKFQASQWGDIERGIKSAYCLRSVEYNCRAGCFSIRGLLGK